jgi:Bacteriophage probable baseplate hub protein
MANGDGQFKPARPTISVAGEDRPFLAEGLTRLLIAETVDGLFRCEATFGNWGNVDGQVGFLYFDRSLFDFGKAMAIKLGTEVLFEGRLTGLEAHFPEGTPPELVVLAEDRFQDLRMTRRTRTFADVSDADVMSAIAGDHGLSPQVDAPGPKHKVLAQVNQSDLAFLRERARSIDAELWMEDRTLHVKSRTNRSNMTVRMTFGAGLREFTALADLAKQRTSVQVSGWDVSSKSALLHESTESVINSEVGSDTSGVSILGSTLGSRKETVAHGVPLGSDEARARADAYLRSVARRFVRGRGIAETSPDLRVGRYAELEGLGPLFSGKYYVAEVQHRFDGEQGIRTEFAAERPGLGQP